jgi:FemAB-related protein (PEP-CTERM system-associated)
MTISLCQNGEGKLWDEFVHSCPEASHCHLSGWRRVIEKTYGHRSLYLWARDGDGVRGVLPLTLMGGRIFSRSLVSLPFLDDGGICVCDEEARIALLQQALVLCEEQKAEILDLRHRHPNTLALPGNGAKTTLVLDLIDDPERMWKGFDAKVRNQIRKAQKSELVASWDGPQALEEFYEVFAQNMRDLGSPVHSKKLFIAIFEEFADSVKFMLVKKGNLTIGGAVCFLFKDTLQVPWASSRREYFSSCPNNLLYWEMIRWGCENGYRRFDFGRSSPGSGTYRFKQQWGTREESLYWQCWKKNNSRQTLIHANDPKYQWMIRVWQNLPVPVARVIGPVVRGHLSS